MSDPISIDKIQNSLIDIRGQMVLLDSDVARIYGVETKRVNEAVRNNPDKFPEEYILDLSLKEWSDLKSNISSSSWGGKNKLPSAFTERGLYMLATILKSKQATEATLTIIETFAKLRDLASNMKALSTAKDEPTQKSLATKSGELITEIFDDHLQASDTETSLELNFAAVPSEARRTKLGSQIQALGQAKALGNYESPESLRIFRTTKHTKDTKFV